MTQQRLNRLMQLLEGAPFVSLALNPGPTLTYLTGLNFHLMERPTVLLFAPPAQPSIVVPELELRKLENTPYPIQAFPYGDNPASWAAAFDQAVNAVQLDGKTVGIEPNRLRFLELNFLQTAAPHARFLSAEDQLSQLRMAKDQEEISAMRKAVEIAQRALEATIPAIHTGVSERQIASELSIQLLRAGSEAEVPFAPIVSSGPNSANPHASPSDRKLQPGDLLVIDWGASYHGYVSDLTRTFAISETKPEMKRIFETVQAANTAGRAASRPGIPAGEVDRAARAVIEKAGYGKYFTHRVGHGLGMEGHEPPYMFGENELVLKPGMTFTIEPGIYIPGVNGVRIEDDIVVTEDGAESLSDMARSWRVLH